MLEVKEMGKGNSIYKRVVLEFVNSAVNICSNTISCFEVVPLFPAPTTIQMRPTKDLALLFSCTRAQNTTWLAPFC